MKISTAFWGHTKSLFFATLLAESCVLLKHMGKYHIVCENQRGRNLKICNLDSIPGLLQTPVNLLICVCLNFLNIYIELTPSPPFPRNSGVMIELPHTPEFC